MHPSSQYSSAQPSGGCGSAPLVSASATMSAASTASSASPPASLRMASRLRLVRDRDAHARAAAVARRDALFVAQRAEDARARRARWRGRRLVLLVVQADALEQRRGAAERRSGGEAPAC